eukprot:TRINITY_DN485_c0_g1_i1.p1 TRINITY_DN485_c0_g1~~TRINITY_DN485_c0_g1_i1.p1  ORF type:complete len:316 (-),score=49.64 TRINITY_DN485_c0_g1_i1:98-1045(-)
MCIRDSINAEYGGKGLRRFNSKNIFIVETKQKKGMKVVVLLLLCSVVYISCQRQCQSQITGAVCGGQFTYGGDFKPYCVAVTGTMPADSPCITQLGYSYPPGVKVCSGTTSNINVAQYTAAYFVALPGNVQTYRADCKRQPNNNPACCDVFSTRVYCDKPSCKCPVPCTGIVFQNRTISERPLSSLQCFSDCVSCANLDNGGYTDAYCSSLRPSQSVAGTYYASKGDTNCCYEKVAANGGTSGTPGGTGGTSGTADGDGDGDGDSDSGLDGGAIAGIVIGTIFGTIFIVAIIAIIVVLVLLRKRVHDKFKSMVGQ